MDSNIECLAPVTSKEPSLGLGHSSFKEHSKKKGKKRLKQGKNGGVHLQGKEGLIFQRHKRAPIIKDTQQI